MGTCFSDTSAKPEMNTNSSPKSIQRQSAPVSVTGKRCVKVLLLGPGDTGKSTCFKQMSLIHNEGFDEKIIDEYKSAVRSNTVLGMKALIDACKDFEYPIDERLIPAAEEFDNMDDSDIQLKINTIWNKKIAKYIKDLWTEDSIRKVYQRNNEFQIVENAKYYFENIDRIAEDDYRPTPFDILSTRTKTTGVTEKVINVSDNLDFKLVDVGGQRSERKKVYSLLIFLIAIV